jgi:RNA polymerase sigma factor (sigma-70 family)
MTPDSELLRRYAGTGSEDAFAELVRRHLDLVYSAALRQVNGDAHLAQDVAQSVFTDLARKASPLSRREAITGWLYTSAHFAAAKAVRSEQRRHTHEQDAHDMRELFHDPTSGLDWEKLRPVLDEVMHELKEADREAILLRYFENRPLAEIGAKLGLSENAARMRVERALEKLRTFLTRRGVTTVAAISTVISANAVQIAPAGLATTLTGASLAAAAAGTGTLAVLKMMTMTKLKLAASAIVVAGAATTLVIQHQAQAKLRDRDESLRQQSDQLAQLAADKEHLSNLLAQANVSRGNNLDDLLRLRGEVGLLRKQTNDLALLQEENRRLRARYSQQQNGSKTALQIKEETRENLIAKINYSLQLLIALHDYAEKNGDQFPTNFDQAASFLTDQAKAETNLTTDQFEIVYRGSLTTLPNPANTIVLREKQGWQSPDGTWHKAYGFADGHSEIPSLPGGNFDSWEKQRILRQPYP